MVRRTVERAQRGAGDGARPAADRDHAGLHHLPDAVRLEHLAAARRSCPRCRSPRSSATRCATSTTLARNSSTVSSTCAAHRRVGAHLDQQQLALHRLGRLELDDLDDVTSLLSCLVTCSSGKPRRRRRSSSGRRPRCSVGPTASDSMLKPRRENRPETRASTPGLFSTSTESVCCSSCASSWTAAAHVRWVRDSSSPSNRAGCAAAMIWSLPVPAGTIGHTCASCPTTKSMTTGRSLIAIAFSIARSTSSLATRPAARRSRSPRPASRSRGCGACGCRGRSGSSARRRRGSATAGPCRGCRC